MNASHRISEETKRSLQEYRSRGGNYGLASGRPSFGATSVIQQLGVTGPCVFFSGALVIEPETGSVLLEETLTVKELAVVLDFAREENLFIEAYTRENYFINTPSPLADVHASYLGSVSRISSLDSIIASEAILKLVLILTSSAEEGKLRAFEKRNTGLAVSFGYGAAHPNLVFANVTSPNASRTRAFEIVTSRLGLQANNIAAFGDAEADIPFLTLAGLGVAMGNAPTVVKEASDFVTKTVEEDGVSFVVKQLAPKCSNTTRTS